MPRSYRQAAVAAAVAIFALGGCRDANKTGGAAGSSSGLCDDGAPAAATCPGDAVADAAFSAEVGRLLQRVAGTTGRRATEVSVWRGDELERERDFTVGYRALDRQSAAPKPGGSPSVGSGTYHCITLSFTESRGVWAPRVPACLPGLGPTGGAQFRAGGLRSK